MGSTQTASRKIQGVMSAATLASPRQVQLAQVAIPSPPRGHVRVRLEGCGVCASNLPPWEGREWFQYPFEPGQLGHEGWGTIDAVGDGVRAFSCGQRVTFLSNHAYAQYDVAPVEHVVALPGSLDATALPGEPLGCAMNIFERSEIRPGQTVAILGIGFLGAMLTQLAANAGARVLAVSRRTFSLDIARRCGADTTIQMDDHWRIIQRIGNLTQDRMCDVVIECVGKQWPLDLAGELTAERGRLVVAGYHQDGLRQVNMQLWNWRGLDVINAHEREMARYTDGIRRAIDAVVQGRLDVSWLLTHRYRLDELGEALAATADRPDGFLKAVIMMDD